MKLEIGWGTDLQALIDNGRILNFTALGSH